MEEGWVKVPHVQRVRRGDKVHLYFRRGDHREGPLASADGSPELLDEVNAILRRLARADAAQRPRAGTVGGALLDYRRTADFIALASTTQAGYDRLIDELVEDIGATRLDEVTRAWVIDLRNAWALRGHRAANMRAQVLKNALAPIVDDDADSRITGDPFNRVKKVKRPHDMGEAHPIWEDAEVQAAIDEAVVRGQPGLARAIALGRWGGFRRLTICTLPRNARVEGYDDQGRSHRRLYWITQKRKVLADKREDPRLTALLASTANQALTIAYNQRGQPWKERQLNQALQRLLDRLAVAGRVRGAVDGDGRVTCPLTIHGLRHSRGVELAMAGASDAEIMAQLEHATDRAAKIYRRQADRRQLADAGQDKVERVVKLRARRSGAATARNTG